MHLALPTRRSSNPPVYATRSSRFPTIRRSRVQTLLFSVCGFGVILFFLSRIFGGNGVPSGTPPVVIVTVLDPTHHTKEYLENIKDNRIEYANKHGMVPLVCRMCSGLIPIILGYKAFLPAVNDYDLHGSPNSWSRVPALRHALTKFPHTTFFWFLDQNSLIMNPDLTVEAHIMNPKRLESLLLKDQPIVPPDSVIKTFPLLKGGQVDVVLSQDKDGLAPSSIILRRGEWAKFFLDTWFDPLYRSYNFQKAETHALVS